MSNKGTSGLLRGVPAVVLCLMSLGILDAGLRPESVLGQLREDVRFERNLNILDAQKARPAARPAPAPAQPEPQVIVIERPERAATPKPAEKLSPEMKAALKSVETIPPDMKAILKRLDELTEEVSGLRKQLGRQDKTPQTAPTPGK